MNRVEITGNLTRDPELKLTTKGNTILSFSVAVNERQRNASGEWEDYPNYVDCVMFGNRAETVSRFLAKGSKVVVEGRLHQSRWEKDGQRRSKLDVYVDNVEWMSPKKQAEVVYDNGLSDTPIPF